MATSVDGYNFQPRLIDQVTVPVDHVFTESSTQEYAIGTEFETWEFGQRQRFRYCKNASVALSKALMCQAPANIANHVEHLGGASTTGAAGTKEIVIGQTMTTALTANQYDNGTVVVNKATGIGDIYYIKSHTNSVTPTLTLYNKIRTAVDTTSEFTLVANKANGVIVMPTTATGQPVGVPLIDVTADYYFWAQVSGPCPMIVDTGETLVIGEPAGYPATISVAGAVGVPGATDAVFGLVASVNIAAEVATINLNLA